MSVHISSPVWKLRGLTPVQKLILLKVADSANDEGVCWPSLSTIAEDCGCSVRSVSRSISYFEELNILSHDRRFNTSNMYKFSMDTVSTMDTMSIPPRHHVHSTIDTMSNDYRHHVQLTVKEPSVEPSGNRENSPTAQKCVAEGKISGSNESVDSSKKDAEPKKEKEKGSAQKEKELHPLHRRFILMFQSSILKNIRPAAEMRAWKKIEKHCDESDLELLEWFYALPKNPDVCDKRWNRKTTPAILMNDFAVQLENATEHKNKSKQTFTSNPQQSEETIGDLEQF